MRGTWALRVGLATIAVVGTGTQAAAQGGDWEHFGYALGDPDAPVHVVELGDFACSACALFWQDTWPRVRTELIDTGRVYWRHVPFLLGFRRGDAAAGAAECAGEQGRFWPMHDRLFDGQQEWTRARHPLEIFRRYASELDLDVDMLVECYEKGRTEERTRAATRAARDARVRETPTFFINGRRALGALEFDLFLELVQDAERELGDLGEAARRRRASTVEESL